MAFGNGKMIMLEGGGDEEYSWVQRGWSGAGIVTVSNCDSLVAL